LIDGNDGVNGGFQDGGSADFACRAISRACSRSVMSRNELNGGSVKTSGRSPLRQNLASQSTNFCLTTQLLSSLRASSAYGLQNAVVSSSLN
jgi:hypothetical protein